MRKKRKRISELLYNEDFFYINWVQYINERGKIIGIGHFSIVEIKEEKNRYAIWKSNNLDYNEKYYKNHKNIISTRIKKYNRTEKGKKIQSKAIRKYFKTEKGKRTAKKHSHKRRNLGFIELNQFFLNSHAHHIDKEYIIYIPKELHQSVYHNIWMDKGMTEINRKAFEWILKQHIEDAYKLKIKMKQYYDNKK